MNEENKYKIICAILFALIGFLVSWFNIGAILFQDNVVQDDFRQSYFWVWQYWDPELFKNSFFVSMYQSHLIRTPLLNSLFHLAPSFVNSPILFSKTMAIFVGTISTLFAYLFFNAFSKNKILSFMFAFFMSFVFWSTDHVPNGCTRSFLWAGLYAYLYFRELKKYHLASLVNLFLLFVSPFTFLLCLVMEFYNIVLRGNYKIKNTMMFFINVASVALLYLVVFKDIKTQAVGKVFTRHEMESLPEFNIHGRHEIFGAVKGESSWFNSKHWGLPIGNFPEIYFIVAVVLILLIIGLLLYIYRTKILNIFYSNPIILLYSSLTLYFLAQLTFPLLFMPNRYLVVPLLLLVSFLPFLVVNELIKNKTKNHTRMIYLITIFILIIVIFLIKQIKTTIFVTMTPEIKSIIEKTPKDSVIAAHPGLKDISLVPVIAKRAVLVDSERSIAYSMPELEEIRRRVKVAFKIVYTTNKNELIKLMQNNNVTHLLVHMKYYEPEYLNHPWYYRPYNKFLRSLLKDTKDKGYYLENILKKNNADYMVVSLRDIKAG